MIFIILLSKFLINYFEKYEKNILSKNDKTQNLEITEKNNENEIMAENKIGRAHV